MSDTFFGLDITKSLFHKSDNDQKEDAEHLEALLKDVLIHQQKHSGHVHLIELKKIRHQMDKSWEKSRKQIETKIHKVLDQYMLSEDLYARYNDTSYIVVFGSLYETEAHIKCRLICKEIAIALLGEEAEENVVEVMAITEGDEGRLDIQPLSRVDNLVHDMVQSTNQIPLDDEGTGLRNLKFIYRPLLSVRTNVVSTFMCIPVRETQPGRFLSGYDVLDDPTDSYQICNLDLETLNTITHEFDHLVETGARSLMAIPVHFETLSDRKLCGEYLKFCEPVASKHSKRIIFEIIGLPSGIPQSRLQELTSYLQIKSRAVIARLRVEDPNFSPLWASRRHLHLRMRFRMHPWHTLMTMQLFLVMGTLRWEHLWI